MNEDNINWNERLEKFNNDSWLIPRLLFVILSVSFLTILTISLF